MLQEPLKLYPPKSPDLQSTQEHVTDKWEIRSDDSIRQKVDEGIENCTHFLVLLTPRSIDKPWVKTEMDAGFVLKLADECRFIPVRYELPVARLALTQKKLQSNMTGVRAA